MAIESECEGCGVQLRVADEHAGRQARCPQCGILYTVPPQSAPASTAPLSPDVPDDPSESSQTGWYVQTPEGESYGPVEKDVLDRWTTEGRVTAQSQLRPSDSAKWQSATDIYPQLAAASAGAADNPFRENPYSSPHEKTTKFREPHRGAMILIFGILGFIVCVVFSPVAWIMGSADLKKIDAGVMDPEGRTLTQVGMILGIIQSCLMLLGLAAFLLWILFVVGVGVANM